MRPLLLSWLAVLAALLGAPAAAQTEFPPRPDGPVYDGANIIPDVDERLLDARLREYNASTGRALIVATVPSLGSETIETYAETLFNDEWGIGGAETDAGLLLLVAPNERKVRIETGIGLQEYVTDILSGRIIRDEITPRFREGDFAGGINAGVDALITQLDRDPADAKAVAEAAALAERQQGRRGGGGSPFVGMIFPLIMIGLFFMLSRGRRGVRGRRYRRRGAAGAVGDVLLWTAINAAMNSGRGGGGGWGGGGGGGFGGGGGGFGGFGGGMSGGGGASGSW